MSIARDITTQTSAPSTRSGTQDGPQANSRHPRGLTVLATTELWERFSFYGMQALLMLYMTTRLVPLAGHGGVWGWLGLRRALQSVLGPLSDQAYASQIFGLYTGLVYLTPLAGGLLGDRLLGRRQTVLLGGALMALGHFLLAVEAAFLPALLLLILGSGCLKGNIATQVGALYAPADRRRDRAYLLFNLGINLGAFAGPLVCGVLGEQGNWHLGFAMAGLGMLVGLAIYVIGWRHLPRDTAIAHPCAEAQPLTDARRRVGVLLALVALTAFYNIPVGEGFNVFPLWIDAAANRQLGGFTIPVSWYLAADGLVTVLASPLVVMLWKRQTERGTLPPVALRIGIGCAAMAAADGLLAILAHLWPLPHSLGPLAGYAYFLLASSAYLYVMPVLLAAVAGAAPPRLTATMMGAAYAGLFVANLTAGWLARFYEPWGAARFWAFHAAIAATGACLAVIARRPLSLPDEQP
ncbi:peptide MFS transporter [Novosphingobium terrae]|uniref:peptide MFS transporter n=1 Tax=Novosphingobium terrae TaxID=2726189 RepID=UPI00198251BD|nr:peptide MFS transporter [Novosphingobium terrae]